MSHFLKGYLQITKMMCKTTVNYIDVFETYLEYYLLFHKELLPLDHFDGMWVAQVVDHLAQLLSRLAVLADAYLMEKEANQEEKKQIENNPDLELDAD